MTRELGDPACALPPPQGQPTSLWTPSPFPEISREGSCPSETWRACHYTFVQAWRSYSTFLNFAVNLF